MIESRLRKYLTLRGGGGEGVVEEVGVGGRGGGFKVKGNRRALTAKTRLLHAIFVFL